MSLRNELSIQLTDDEIAEIKNVIETKNHCKCTYDITFNNIWFYSPSGGVELRLGFVFTYRLIVSRVCFTHKRQGCMTEILEILKRICKEKGIPKIIIQSTETEEIVNFCNKNGFIPDPTASFASFDGSGLILGDYYLDIDEITKE